MEASSGRGSAIRTSEAARRRAGNLLQRRRSDLGYRRRPAFVADTGLNGRLVSDLENGRQPNFRPATLQQIARAYAVTYESLVAVMAGEGDALVPDPGRGPAAVPLRAASGVWLPPVTAARLAQAAPYADRISRRLEDLAAGGVASPSGAQVFGPGTADARTWDGLAGRMPQEQCVWMLAELQAGEARRDGPVPFPHDHRCGDGSGPSV